MQQMIIDQWNSIFEVDTSFTFWILLALFIELLFTLYLNYRQFTHINSITSVPKLVEEYGERIYTSVDLDFSREIALDQLSLECGKKAYTIVVLMLTIIINGFYIVWWIAETITPVWPNSFSPSVSRNMSFAVLLYICYEVIMIPVKAQELKLREKHGKYKKEPKGELVVAPHAVLLLMEILLNLIPVALGAALNTWIIKTIDEKHVFVQAVIFITFYYVFILLYPSLSIYVLIRSDEFPKIHAPYLHRLCDTTGFPKKDLYCLKLPKGSNDTAFFFGFLWFQKVVVLRHNSSQEQSQQQQQQHGHQNQPASSSNSPHDRESETVLTNQDVEAVVAHELGHWKNGHSDTLLYLWHGLHISYFIFAFALRSSYRPVFRNAGLSANNPEDVWKGILILPGMIIALDLLLRIYYNCFHLILQWRQHKSESEADEFATVTMGYGKQLGKALVKMCIQEQFFPSQDPYYSVVYHSHPGVVERLQQISNLRKTHRKSN